MQDIDNNMDELFRKAAEKYAPKKGESQWNNILPALSENPIEPLTKKNNSKKNIAFLLLLLLMIFSVFVLIKISGSKNETTQINKSSEKDNPVNSSANNNNNKIDESSTSFYHNKTREKKSGDIKAKDIIEANQNATVKNNQHINSSNTVYNYSSINNLKHDERNFSELQIDSTNKIVSQLNNVDSAQSTISKKSISFKKQSRLYIGFITAPEFNQIKNQGIRKPGFDIGVIAGYKLGNKISVETGLLLNKKNYFSDGKYFNMDKIEASMPAGMEVMNLKGSSTFLRIPLMFKYNVLCKKNATVFSSAGISSYIITDEENDYLTLLNGAEQQMKGSYKKASKYFAATVDVSAGYENKIGKLTSVQIEPYIEIPLKGVGMGSMPVTSMGLQVGIIKFIK